MTMLHLATAHEQIDEGGNDFQAKASLCEGLHVRTCAFCRDVFVSANCF